MSLANDMISTTEKYVAEACPAIDRLARLAEVLKMDGAQEDLLSSRRGIQSPEFKLIVLGRFKNGKSTFMNILMGRLARPLPELPGFRGGFLPMDDLPTTARLTTIRYGEEPGVTVVKRDGSREPKTLTWFVGNSPLKPGQQANAAAFGNVQEFELTYPFENGRAGIVLLDSPGTDEDAERTLIARRALNECDAAIMLFRSDALLGEKEREFVQDMRDRGLTSFFTVINRWYSPSHNGARPVDERLKAFVWDKRVTQLEDGPPYDGQDLAEKKIFFVDALTALQGKLEDDPERLRASGMEDFERALHDYLETERRRVQVLRWVDKASGAGQAIQKYIEQQIPALEREQETFQRKFEEIRPQLEAQRRRKGTLPRKFADFYARCVGVLMTDFEKLIDAIRDELPAHVERSELKELSGLGNVLWSAVSRSKKEAIAREVTRIATDYTEARIQQWRRAEPPTPGARKVLQPIFDQFLEEIRAEIESIEAQFDRMNLELTGYTPQHEGKLGEASKGVWMNRIFPAAVGLVFGPDMAVYGASNGWKGVGKSLLVHTGVVGGVAAAATVATGGVALPVLVAAWAAAFALRAMWHGSDLKREIKQKVVHGFVWGSEYEETDPATGQARLVRFEGLRGEPKRVRPGMERAVVQMFAEFERVLTERLNAEIDREIQRFEAMRKENALNLDERIRLKEEYSKALADTKACRTMLADIRLQAEAVL